MALVSPGAQSKRPIRGRTTLAWARGLLLMLVAPLLWLFKWIADEGLKSALDRMIDGCRENPWVLTWVLLGFLVAACCAILYLHSSRARIEAALRHLEIQDESASQCRIVLFLSPSSEDFYVQYYNLLVREAHRRASATRQIVVAALWPDQAFLGVEPPELSVELIARYRTIAGVFLIPKEPDDAGNRRGILAIGEKYPTTLLDVYPGKEHDPSLPPFVGGDERLGGQKAADIALRYFRGNPRTLRRVLVLRGRNTQWETQRIQSFRAALEKAFCEVDSGPPVVAESRNDLNYARDQARQYVRQLIDDPAEISALSTDPGWAESVGDIDLIFACNDDMARGAFDALHDPSMLAQRTQGWVPRIIGYDGSPSMRDLMQHHECILGTVQVDLPGQVQRAMDVMTRLLDRPGPTSVGERLELVPPTALFNPRLLRSHAS